MATTINLKHGTTKTPGQKVFAVADWNADHRITNDLDLGAFNLTTTGAVNAGSGTIQHVPAADADIVNKKFLTDNYSRHEDGDTQGQLNSWDIPSDKWVKSTFAFLDEVNKILVLGEGGLRLDAGGVEPAFAEASIYWENNSLQVDTDVDHEHYNPGRNNVTKVQNKTGSTILKGKVVYINGSQGGNSTIALADNSAEITSDSTLGFTQAQVLENEFTYIVTNGLLRFQDTSMFVAGDKLYLDTNGDATKIEPVSPAHLVTLGVVKNVNANTGEIDVSIQNGFELEEIHDVLITNIADKQTLYYDNSASLWKNSNTVFIDELNSRVGIDMSLPDVKFHIEGETDAKLRMKNTGNAASILLVGSNRSSESNSVAVVRALWDGNNIGDILFRAGDDLVNKDNGDILFRTNSGGATPSNKMIISSTGPIGFDTLTPTQLLSVKEKGGMTSIGGFAIKLTNKTGSNSVEGQAVRTSTTTANAVQTCAANDANCIGFIYNAGISDGSEVWVVEGGVGEVLIDAGGCALGDRIVTSATAGSCASNNAPSVAVHFQECGHVNEARGGAGLVKANIHLN